MTGLLAGDGVCRLYAAIVNDELVFTTAVVRDVWLGIDRFLHRMVRIFAGAAVRETS